MGSNRFLPRGFQGSFAISFWLSVSVIWTLCCWSVALSFLFFVSCPAFSRFQLLTLLSTWRDFFRFSAFLFWLWRLSKFLSSSLKVAPELSWVTRQMKNVWRLRSNSATSHPRSFVKVQNLVQSEWTSFYYPYQYHSTSCDPFLFRCFT